MSAILKEENIAYGYLEPYTVNTKYDCDNYKDEDWYKYIKSLHYDDDKHISLMKKMVDKKGNDYIDRYSIPVKHINRLKGLIGDTDMYMSINSHYCLGGHSCNTIGRLNALFVDVDYKKLEEFKYLKPEQMLSLITEEIDIPIPTICKSTGNGLMLEWRLSDTKASKKAINMWSNIEKELVLRLKEYGADQSVTDVARVTRLVGSINSKGGSVVTLTTCLTNNITNNWDNLQTYELSDFTECTELFPIRKETNIKKTKAVTTTRKNNMPKQYKSKGSKVTMPKTKSILELYTKRANDIEKLARLRKNRTSEGWRELMFFIYSLNLMYQGVTTEIAFRRLENLNEIIAIPLDLKELEYAFKSSSNSASKYFDLQEKYDGNQSLVDYFKNTGVYMYSNAKIIEELGITEEEQKSMETLIGTDEKKVRKKARNKKYYEENKEEIQNKYENKLKSEGKLTKKEELYEIYCKTKNLRAEGFKNKEISQVLKLPIKTLERYISNMKKNGLL